MPRRRHALPVLVATGTCAAAVVGCGPSPDPEDPAPAVASFGQPIQGGYLDEVDKSVVGIVILSGGGIAGCSGTLIAPNVVLTAQHCVAESSSGGGVICGQTTFFAPHPANEVMVHTETSTPMMPSLYTQAAEVALPPADSSFCGNDQAILILTEPIDGAVAAPITPRVDEPLATGELYSAIGYGQLYDSPQAPSGTRYRRDALAVQCVGEVCGAPAYPNYLTEKEWIGETGICSGDSGGPAIDALGRVSGVASRGGAECTSPVYGHVFGWGQWIKDTTAYAAGLLGTDPPAWATGWPTDPAYSQPVGTGCDLPEQCPSGICHEGVCTRLCNDASPCPPGFGCSVDFGICERRIIAAPDDSIDNGAPTGCSVSSRTDADDPTQPIPWVIALGLITALRSLRRARGRG